MSWDETIVQSIKIILGVAALAILVKIVVILEQIRDILFSFNA